MTKEELRLHRECAVKILYVRDLLKEDIKNIYAQYPVVDPFVRKIVEGICEIQEKIDIIIENNLENYSITRLGYVDRAILRLAVYEMLNDLNPKIVINEALEISKKYTQTDDFNSSAFNNKILDKIAKDLNSER